MPFSDDEEEIVPKSVSNYHFEDDDKEPVSFAVLPVKWSEKDCVDSSNKIIFMRGIADDGLQTMYKPVKAWRFDLSNIKPEISILTKYNLWIKLQKPRKSFEELIRTVLITVHCFHFVKRYPDASAKSVWEHLSRVFGLYDVKPSQNDLVDNMVLISEAVKKDDSLAKSKFLTTFLEENPSKRSLPDEDFSSTSASGFIVDDGMIEAADESDDDDYFDSVCALCDNGGELLCCEGCCLRSFHATVEDGDESLCDSLGFTKKQVNAMQEDFLCLNCQYKQHQCFVCQKLGSSDKSSGAEVFQCVSATCGYFYHPRCVANLLHKGNKAAAEALEKRIASGESFTCPYHKCCVCKQVEDKKDPELQFAVCRRCPKSYHRKCLPLEISFGNIKQRGIVTRAWDDLLVNRVLIYCLDHEIDARLLTPPRDHIQFPSRKEKNIIAKGKKYQAPEIHSVKEKAALKKNNLSAGACHERKAKGLSSAWKEAASIKEERVSSGQDTIGKVKQPVVSGKPLKKVKRSSAVEGDKAHAAKKNPDSLGVRLFNLMGEREQLKLRKEEDADTEDSRTARAPALKKYSSELPALDAASEWRVLGLMKDAASEITLDEIRQKHTLPSTHLNSSNHTMDKAITLGKIEASVQAVRIALAKLVEGNDIEDAKAVCEPEVLSQIFRWKDKLKVYLAPFLYGPRYSSFGRHFTKVNKLQQIVDRLHSYVQDGDMIVDFCCGANDFSCLMKKKLEETGKKCSYKNYDIFQAKNDFNFEKRDWMTVQKAELLPGSKLVMGLNPPFGVRASLANKFIDKALEFEPKLLILIVPPETERLDQKKSRYELVWEDDQCLSGKSFYLPGSIDDRDKQMDQWNLVSPPLSLWSRPEWASKHKEIAQKQGHLRNQVNELHVEGDNNGMDVSLQVIGEQDFTVTGGTPMSDDAPDKLVDTSVPTDDAGMDVDMEINETETGKTIVETAESENVNSVIGRNDFHNSKPGPNKRSKKRKKMRDSSGRGLHEISTNERGAQKHPRNDRYHVESHHSMLGQRSSVDARFIPHLEPLGATYGGNLAGFHDETERMYLMDAPTMGGTHRRLESEQFSSWMRFGPDLTDYGSYSDVMREADLRQLISFYGQDLDPLGPPPRGYIGSSSVYDYTMPQASSPYEHLSSGPEPSFGIPGPVTQRYAPRLDELNRMSMNPRGSESPFARIDGGFDHRSRSPLAPPQLGYGTNPMGYASGTRRPYIP